MLCRVPRVSASEVLVRQPQETHPLIFNVGRFLAGEAIASIAAVRKWQGDYPNTPHVTADPEALVLGEPTFEGEFITIPCSGGTHGAYYYIEVDINVVDLGIRGVDGWLLVKDHDA